MQTVKFAILKCEWKTKAANAVPGPAWTADMLRKVFQDRNGWSLGHWWDDCSLGHRKLEFEVFDLGLLDGVQGTLSDTDLRDRVVELARVRGVPLGTYQHHVVFVDPPPNAAFQYRGSAIADRTDRHQTIAHEVGHALGLGHPWGFDRDGAPDEYGGPYCIMGDFTLHHEAAAPPLSPADLAMIGPDFWRLGVQPAAATLFKHWKDFRTWNRIATIAPGSNGALDLASISGSSSSAPMLYRIPVGPDQDYFVEYRVPAGWDSGVEVPTIVVHSIGLPSRQWSSGANSALGQVWFEKALRPPFHDAWESTVPSIGIEVVGLSADRSVATLMVSSPAAGRRATLVERPPRIVQDGHRQRGIVYRSSRNDPGLCDGDAKPYTVTIVDLRETVELDLVTLGMQLPVVDEWRIGSYVIANQAPFQARDLDVYVTWTTIEPASPPHPPTLATYRSNSWNRVPDVTITPRVDGCTLTALPGGRGFTVRVEALVRDGAGPLNAAYTSRIASADVTFAGQRIEWDQDYRDDVEACWVRRLRHGTRDLLRIEHRPRPPWLDLADRRAVIRVEERVDEKARATRKPRDGR